MDMTKLYLRPLAKARIAERLPALRHMGFAAPRYTLARTWPTRIDQSMPRAL